MKRTNWITWLGAPIDAIAPSNVIHLVLFMGDS